MRHFQNIVIQSKYDDVDWRSFVYCTDDYGDKWELRGYGNTPAEAARNAWANYNDYANWDVYGYVI